MRGVVLGAFVALSALSAMSATPAMANADDAKWIGRCVADNQDQGQTQGVIAAYCACMNDQMSEDETQSITQWEKTHKKEADMCSKKAGWKG
ncbi:MAG TPA: hypothetical protein VGG69_08835 [Rhizomicrobium sp.]|jgi:hypothetical protein